MSKLENKLQLVSEIAKQKGINDFDILLSSGEEFSLKSENAEISEYKVSSSQILGIRTIIDEKIGTSYCEAFDRDALEFMIDQSINNARFGKVNEFEKIEVARSEIIDGTNTKNLSTEISDTEKMIEQAIYLEEGVKNKSSQVKSAPYNGLGEQSSESLYLNSKGTFCTERNRMFYCYTSALIDDAGKQSMHHKSSYARQFSDLLISDCINDSYNHAINLLDATPSKTGKYDVIFDIDCLSDLLSCFSNIFSGKATVNGFNPLKDKLGQSIASSELTIKDIPNYVDGFNYTAFDAEGNLTSETTLIEKGSYEGIYQNSSTAKELNMDNTFNAARSPKGSLDVSGSNTIISTGNANSKDMHVGQYMNIIALQGVHSGSDSTSGDFSFGASGYLMEGDEIIQAVKGITVSGNFYRLLNQIKSIGDTTLSNSSMGLFSPEIRFSGLTIAGT